MHSCGTSRGLCQTASMKLPSAARTCRPLCSPVRVCSIRLSCVRPVHRTALLLPRRRRPVGRNANAGLAVTTSSASAQQVPAAKAFDKSWFKKVNGIETCVRGALGRCKDPNCPRSHLCPVPLANGKPCAQKHTALDHLSTKQEVAALPPVLPQSGIAFSCLAVSVRQPADSLPPQPAQAHAYCPPKPVAPASSASKPPNSVPLPGCKLFVDLFAGASAPLSAAIAALGLARVEPLDKLHGCGFDLLMTCSSPVCVLWPVPV